MTPRSPHSARADVGPLERRRLRERGLVELAQLLDNAAYWRAFDMARFEALLAFAPPPLDEVGIGVLLGFGEAPDGRLHPRALNAARQLKLPPEVQAAFHACLDRLERAVAARERMASLEAEGFRKCMPAPGVRAVALRAVGGAKLRLLDVDPARALPLGHAIGLEAKDAKGRVLEPTVEHSHGAPVWTRSQDGFRFALLVPGTYRVHVPGRLGALLLASE